MSVATTRGVRVEVQARYVPEQSDPPNHWLFAYQVTILNGSDAPVQLIARHWRITDGEGNVEEVRGAGVVGHQPRLEPGQGFQYVSAAPLKTPVGAMSGSYQMVVDNGEGFDAEIAPFTLADPAHLN